MYPYNPSINPQNVVKGFDGKQSVMTQNRKAKEGETQRLHSKTFTAWINAHFRKINIRIEDLSELTDGVYLIKLIEVLTGQPCTLKYIHNPTKPIHKTENVTIALQFLNQFVRTNIAPSDIANGDVKVILALIWRMIVSFQVTNDHVTPSGKNQQEKSALALRKEAKLKLLQWVKEKTGITVTDCDVSFQDGILFCKLIQAYNNDLIDLSVLNPNDPYTNLSYAFDIAEKVLGIEKMLDPIDFCNPDPSSRPDEQCVMTYLSHFPIAFLQRQTPSPIAPLSFNLPSSTPSSSSSSSFSGNLPSTNQPHFQPPSNPSHPSHPSSHPSHPSSHPPSHPSSHSSHPSHPPSNFAKAPTATSHHNANARPNLPSNPTNNNTHNNNVLNQFAPIGGQPKPSNAPTNTFGNLSQQVNANSPTSQTFGNLSHQMNVSNPPPQSSQTFGNLSHAVNASNPPPRPAVPRYVITDDIPAPPSHSVAQPPSIPPPSIPPHPSIPPSSFPPSQPPPVNNPPPSSFSQPPSIPPSPSSPFFPHSSTSYPNANLPPSNPSPNPSFDFEPSPPPIPTHPHSQPPQFADNSSSMSFSAPVRPPPPTIPFVFNSLNAPPANLSMMNEIREKEAALRAMEEEMRKQQDEVRRQQEELLREAEKLNSSSNPNVELENQMLQQKLNALRQRMVGQLKLRILEARGLQSKLMGTTDPYVMVILDKYKEKTSVIKNSNFPKWNSEFDFYVNDSSLILNITVYDRSKLSHDSFLGKVEIPVKDLPDGVPTENWFTLQPKQPGKKAYGEIKLSMLYRKDN